MKNEKLTKKELIKRVGRTAGQPEAVVRKVLEALQVEISYAVLDEGYKVPLVSFGTFGPVDFAARDVILRGRRIHAPAQTYLGFWHSVQQRRRHHGHDG